MRTRRRGPGRGSRLALRGMMPLAAIAAIVMSGCSVPGPTPAPTSTAAVPFERDASTAAVIEPELGAMVARSEFVDRSGATVGTIAVFYAGRHRYVVETELRLDDDERVALGLLHEPVDPDSDCARGLSTSFGDIESAGSDEQLLDTEQFFGDPGYHQTAVLTVVSDRVEVCASYVYVASAPLDWQLPDMRPDLAVVDGGPRRSANGAVQAGADGAPASYTVARGDAISAIAERFEVSIDDIFYLNPTRGPSPQDPDLWVGEVLNLDRAAR